MMTEEEKKLYELALSEGKKRFLGECKHKVVKNGHCTQCLRKVFDYHRK